MRLVQDREALLAEGLARGRTAQEVEEGGGLRAHREDAGAHHRADHQGRERA